MGIMSYWVVVIGAICIAVVTLIHDLDKQKIEYEKRKTYCTEDKILIRDAVYGRYYCLSKDNLTEINE